MQNGGRRIDTEISALVSSILHDDELDRVPNFPPLDLLTTLDILNTLRSGGPQNFEKLRARLKTLRKHEVLTFYMNSLTNLSLISLKEVRHRGAAPVKRVYDIAERGVLLLQLIES